MKRFALIISLIAFFFTSCQNNKKQGEKEDETIETTDSLTETLVDTANRPLISATVQRFIQAYNARDNERINELIHPEVGITFIHRPGAIDRFEKVDKIDFNQPIPSYYPYAKAEHSYTLVYGAVPIFSCETESWNKQGLFIDVTEQTNRLTAIADFFDEYEDNKLDADGRKRIEASEKNSNRIVLTTDTPLVFHVKEIDGKWYVTILDRAYGDCSA